MALLDGASTYGVDKSHLRSAIADLPPQRNGIQSWIKEGGLTWVPESTPVWRGVSEASWQARGHLTTSGNVHGAPVG